MKMYAIDPGASSRGMVGGPPPPTSNCWYVYMEHYTTGMQIHTLQYAYILVQSTNSRAHRTEMAQINMKRTFQNKNHTSCKCIRIPQKMGYCLSHPREYWMIYRGPGFLDVIWLGSSPIPSIPSPVSELDWRHAGQLADEKMGEDQIIRRRENLVLYILYSLCHLPPPHCLCCFLGYRIVIYSRAHVCTTVSLSRPVSLSVQLWVSPFPVCINVSLSLSVHL